MRYAVLHKPVGATPLEAISAWRTSADIPSETPVSYAGRLDPMAHGLLLVLIGDECKRQKDYTGLDKEYEIEVLLGVGTDTGDVLGIPRTDAFVSPSLAKIQSALSKEHGTHMRAYPVYSSKTVNGVPLFLHALQGTLDTITIPEHEETIYDLKLEEFRSISHAELRARVRDMLALAPTSDEPSKALGADFRIGAIRPAWEELLATERPYPLLRLRVTSGSGAYMRSLAERVGTSLGTSGMALSIKRTKIGKYRFGFWTKQYR